MLCHPSLPCIPLLNPYGLIRICHAPPAPLLINQVTNNIPAVLFDATSEFSHPGRRTASLSRQSGKKWQRGAADQETGGTVCACIFFFFRGGNDCQFRLWLQITDRFRGGRATGDSRCILAVPIGSQFGLSIKCDVRKFGFFFLFVLFLSIF